MPTQHQLPAVPADYREAREGYHRLAYSTVAEARRLATTRFGLRYTGGGFGTPIFGPDEQVRVRPGEIVHKKGESTRVAPITTVRAAADFLGIDPGTDAAEHDSPPLGDIDADLGATQETGELLGAWFGLAWTALEQLRESDGAIDADETQLWPGHFDPATAIGDADSGRRATYGASPGDGGSAEPYLYVGPWTALDTDDPYWNETVRFSGASMAYAELRASKDPAAAALAFFQRGLERLEQLPS